MGKFSFKSLSFILLFSVMALIVTGCGSDASSASGSTSGDSNNDDKIVIKFAHHLSKTHSLGEQVQKFADIVKEKSDGKIKVEIYPSGQLGDQRDLFEGLQQGTVDMSLGDTGVLANYYQPVGILDLPYIFEGMAHSKAALDAGLEKELKKGILEEAGIRTLAIEPLAFRSTVTAEAQPESIEDFEGLKLRTLQSPQIVDAFQAVGVQPQALATGEAFSAMETGTVDGMESNPEFLASISIWEVGNYFIDTKHNLTHETINISDDFYTSLSEENQKIIDESVEETVEWFYDYAIKVDKEGRERLKEEGIKPLDVDISPMKEAAKPIREKFIEDNGLEDLYKYIKENKGK